MSIVDGAVDVLLNNEDKFDLFFHAWISLGDPNYILLGSLWDEVVNSEWYGGKLNLVNLDSAADKTLVNDEELQVIDQYSIGLKITLEKLDNTRDISLNFNGVEYKVGEDITEDIIYYDDTKSEYVMDLKLLIEQLGIGEEEWNNGTLEVSYSERE